MVFPCCQSSNHCLKPSMTHMWRLLITENNQNKKQNCVHLGEEMIYTVSKGPSQLLVTQWGWMMHICIGKLIIIGSDNGLSPGRHQAIIWTNTGILLIGLWGQTPVKFKSKFKYFHWKTRQIWGIWKLRPAYSPETPNLGQNRWCFVPCDLEIWWMTLENNRAPLLCCFKLCATFHSHRWIQTGVAVRKRPIWVKFYDF